MKLIVGRMVVEDGIHKNAHCTNFKEFRLKDKSNDLYLKKI